PKPRMIAIQLANSETGVIQPIADLAKSGAGIRFHCDAAQAIGRIPVSFHDLGVTSMTLSGHKIHGPPGIGAMVIRKGFPLPAMILGGHQQEGIRAGTEPTALIVGLATAVKKAVAMHAAEYRRLMEIRDRFEQKILTSTEAVINGPTDSAK